MEARKMDSKKFFIGVGQFLLLMTAMVGLVCIVAPHHKDTPERPLAPGIHTHEVTYIRVIIHDSSAGTLQFETEDHTLYAIPIVGAQPTALKSGQFANVYLRQIFEVKGSEGEKYALYAGGFVPCTQSTPCALFLQADLLQKTDATAARNTLKVKDLGASFALEWR